MLKLRHSWTGVEGAINAWVTTSGILSDDWDEVVEAAHAQESEDTFSDHHDTAQQVIMDVPTT